MRQSCIRQWTSQAIPYTLLRSRPAAARDIYVDEVNPAHFHPTAIDTILTNMSRLSVLNYHSSWNPAAPYLEQVMHPGGFCVQNFEVSVSCFFCLVFCSRPYYFPWEVLQFPSQRHQQGQWGSNRCSCAFKHVEYLPMQPLRRVCCTMRI